MKSLRQRLADLPGTSINKFTTKAADNFSYTDLVDGSKSDHQGIRIHYVTTRTHSSYCLRLPRWLSDWLVSVCMFLAINLM